MSSLVLIHALSRRLTHRVILLLEATARLRGHGLPFGGLALAAKSVSYVTKRQVSIMKPRLTHSSKRCPHYVGKEHKEGSTRGQRPLRQCAAPPDSCRRRWSKKRLLLVGIIRIMAARNRYACWNSSHRRIITRVRVLRQPLHKLAKYLIHRLLRRHGLQCRLVRVF